jgi:hypothetical protein
MTATGTTTQVYQVFIRATPEAIWEAITTPEFTRRYFHGAHITNTAERHLAPAPNGDTWGDSAVLEFDPPRHRRERLRGGLDVRPVRPEDPAGDRPAPGRLTSPTTWSGRCPISSTGSSRPARPSRWT